MKNSDILGWYKHCEWYFHLDPVHGGTTYWPSVYDQVDIDRSRGRNMNNRSNSQDRITYEVIKTKDAEEIVSRLRRVSTNLRLTLFQGPQSEMGRTKWATTNITRVL